MATVHIQKCTIQASHDGPQKLTYKQVREGPNWKELRASQFQQLNMYEEQNVFGAPQPKPPFSNVWHQMTEKRHTAYVTAPNEPEKNVILVKHLLAAWRMIVNVYYGLLSPRKTSLL